MLLIFKPSTARRPEMPSDDRSFEELVSDPRLQLDPGDELLPHLIRFGPSTTSPPWLYEGAPGATVSAQPVERARLSRAAAVPQKGEPE